MTDAERIKLLREFAKSMSENSTTNRVVRAIEVLEATKPEPRYSLNGNGVMCYPGRQVLEFGSTQPAEIDAVIAALNALDADASGGKP